MFKIGTDIIEKSQEIPYSYAHEVFMKLYGDYDYKFIYESKDISPVYGRLSLIGIDPCLRITGKGDDFKIEVLNQRGDFYFAKLSEEDFDMADDVGFSDGVISGKVEKDEASFDESKRSKRKNIAQVLRMLMEKFKISEKVYLGFYGGFSYDFVRQFETIEEKLPEGQVPDFQLLLYDTFIFFDHLKEKTELLVYRESDEEALGAVEDLSKKCKAGEVSESSYQISDARFKLESSDYEEMVEVARDYCKRGEIFEVVFSNIMDAKFSGDPFALYLKYRETNPSPYLFYIDFGHEQLVGASPEMMVRCESGLVHLRPISGTAKRGADPIEDHENMLALLSDEKERAELDMLIDLGRNDLARVSEPGIEISDYRFVEKYSEVMHTVAHVTGRLAEGNTALDALIASLNAGTLTGAPKVAAMNLIESYEKERRGYYGGVIGYLTFSGEMDTGIVIRTAHIRGDHLRFQVGATLLYDSVPEKEHQECMNKAKAFLKTFAND